MNRRGAPWLFAFLALGAAIIGCGASTHESARCVERSEAIAADEPTEAGYTAAEILQPVLGGWECSFTFAEGDPEVVRAGAPAGSSPGQLELRCDLTAVSRIRFEKQGGSGDDRLYCGEVYLRTPCTLDFRTSDQIFEESVQVVADVDVSGVTLQTAVTGWRGKYDFAFVNPGQREATSLEMRFERMAEAANGELVHITSSEEQQGEDVEGVGTVFRAATWECVRAGD